MSTIKVTKEQLSKAFQAYNIESLENPDKFEELDQSEECSELQAGKLIEILKNQGVKEKDSTEEQVDLLIEKLIGSKDTYKNETKLVFLPGEESSIQGLKTIEQELNELKQEGFYIEQVNNNVAILNRTTNSMLTKFDYESLIPTMQRFAQLEGKQDNNNFGNVKEFFAVLRDVYQEDKIQALTILAYLNAPKKK